MKVKALENRYSFILFTSCSWQSAPCVRAVASILAMAFLKYQFSRTLF